MKLFLYSLVAVLLGCSATTKRVGIVHDYMLENGKVLCKFHEGLHYIITNTTLKIKTNKCSALYLVRCQDGKLFEEDTEVTWCGISEMQIQESLSKETP